MPTRVTSNRLIGRERELSELEAALDAASAGRPSLAFVAGDSGVGKTRLLTEVRDRAERSGARAIVGDCVDLGEGELPYAPIVAALRPLARDGDPLLAELGPETRAGLASLLPEFGDAAAPRSGDDPDQARVFEALLTLLAAMSDRAPLLLCIEDIHWADASTRAFLIFLARSLRGERLLVLASYRPDELHRRHPLRPLLASLERGRLARRIELGPLSRDELAQQLGDILDAPPDALLVDRLHARSEGNPLYTEELLAAGDHGRGELPGSLRDALMVRIDALAPDAHELLRVLALGQHVDHDVLAEASELDASALREGLREAVSAQIVVADPDGRLSFRHALLREVVADDLLPGERADLHLALARALDREAGDDDNEVLAAGVTYHYLAAGCQSEAFAAALRAAGAAERQLAHEESSALLERALELWSRVPDAPATSGGDRAALLARAAAAQDQAGARIRAAALYERALAEVDATADPHRAASLLERLASVQRHLARADAALATLERGLALLAPPDVSSERALLLGLKAKFLMLRGRKRDAIRASHEAIEAADAADEPRARSRALNALGSSRISRGEIDEGTADLEASLDIARRLDHVLDVASAYNNLSDALHLMGRSEQAREVMLTGRAWAAERGPVPPWIELQVAEIAIDTGDWEEAERHIPERLPDVGTVHANFRLRSAELALGRGDTAAARPHLDAADDIAWGSDEPQFLGVMGVLRAELERRAGDLEAARAAIRLALDRIETCTDDAVRLARVAAIGTAIEADTALRARDVGDEAALSRALIEAELHVGRAAAAADEGGPVEAAWSLSAEAELARAQGACDPQLHARAAAAWSAVGRPYPEAIMRWRAAEALAGEDRGAAGQAAAAALEIARRLGSHWLVTELEGLVARARLPLPHEAPEPAPEAADAPFGLTPRERQVLALVADGRTNREIGSTLYMAEKTASVHVSRILSKLDVRSRTEAAAVAHRLGLDDDALEQPTRGQQTLG